MPMLDVQRRHAEVFRLRLGDKGKGGRPQKLTDAIRVTSPNRSVVDAFVAVYGGETTAWAHDDASEWQAYLPTTELAIMVLPGQSISQWWEKWAGSVCQRRCDGMTETLTGQECRCPADLVERMGDKAACRPTTRINVLCPDVAVVGAGCLVSHGMIAAETLPQSVAVAEAALSRGLMVPAVLRVVEHKGRTHYVVPQIEIVGVSLRTLGTGEAPARGVGGGMAALPPAGLPPLPGEDTASAEVTAALGERIAALPAAAKAALKTDWQSAGLAPLNRLPAVDVDDATDLIALHERSQSPGEPPAPSDVGGEDAATAHPAAAPPPAPARSKRTTALMATATERYPDRSERLAWASVVLDRKVGTFSGLSVDDESALLDALKVAGVATNG